MMTKSAQVFLVRRSLFVKPSICLRFAVCDAYANARRVSRAKIFYFRFAGPCRFAFKDKKKKKKSKNL